MVKPFADAVKGLKKGEITPQPVQTQFGWHVIQLEDTRDVTPPPFDQVKAAAHERHDPKEAAGVRGGVEEERENRKEALSAPSKDFNPFRCSGSPRTRYFFSNFKNAGSSSTGNAKFLRFLELRTRILAHNDVVGFFRNAAADFSAALRDGVLGLLARQINQRPGEHEGLAGKCLFGASLLAAPAKSTRSSAAASTSAAFSGLRKYAKMLAATTGPTSGTR